VGCGKKVKSQTQNLGGFLWERVAFWKQIVEDKIGVERGDRLVAEPN
jgi:hypothetical protein